MSQMDEAAAQIEGLLDGQPETEPADAPEPEDVAVEEAVAEEGDHEEEVEAEEAEEEPEQSADEESDDEAEQPITTLTELAEALEQPVEDVLANLKHTARVNGEDVEVTLGELVAGYQKDADYRQKTGDLAEQRRAFQSEQEQARAALEQEAMVYGQLLNQVEGALIGEASSERLKQLRDTDFQQYLRLKEDIETRRSALQNARQQAADAYAQRQQQIQAEQQQRLMQTLQAEQEALARDVPDWGDAKRSQLVEFLKAEGFSPEEVAQVYDSRLVKLALKAMQAGDSAKAADFVKKETKKKPRFQKPGAQTDGKVRAKRSQLSKAKSRLGQTKRVEDAAKVIEQLL